MHIQSTDEFISKACSGVVDRLLETKHSEFSDEIPLQDACVGLLKMIEKGDAPLPRTAGHPIQNMLTILRRCIYLFTLGSIYILDSHDALFDSPNTKGMYPEARNLALQVSQNKQPESPSPPQDFPTKQSKRKRRKAKQAQAQARGEALN